MEPKNNILFRWLKKQQPFSLYFTSQTIVFSFLLPYERYKYWGTQDVLHSLFSIHEFSLVIGCAILLSIMALGLLHGAHALVILIILIYSKFEKNNQTLIRIIEIIDRLEELEKWFYKKPNK